MQACTCSGRSRGGAGGPRPPLLLDQTEAKRPEKNFLEAAPPPPPPPLSTDAYKNIMNIDRCKLNVPIKGAWACQACVFLELQFILN